MVIFRPCFYFQTMFQTMLAVVWLLAILDTDHFVVVQQQPHCKQWVPWTHLIIAILDTGPFSDHVGAVVWLLAILDTVPLFDVTGSAY
jgi:hypothetical protein